MVTEFQKIRFGANVEEHRLPEFEERMYSNYRQLGIRPQYKGEKFYSIMSFKRDQPIFTFFDYITVCAINGIVYKFGGLLVDSNQEKLKASFSGIAEMICKETGKDEQFGVAESGTPVLTWDSDDCQIVMFIQGCSLILIYTWNQTDSLLKSKQPKSNKGIFSKLISVFSS